MTLPTTTLGGRLAPASGRGRLDVERGIGWRALLAAASGFPPSGSVPATIEVTRVDVDTATGGSVAAGRSVDHWVRRLGTHQVRTTAHLVGDDLHERFGPIAIAYGITFGDPHTITLRSRRWWLQLGRLGLPLPRRLMPRIVSTCRAVASDASARPIVLDVAVRIADGRDRLVVGYRGRIRACEVDR